MNTTSLPLLPLPRQVRTLPGELFFSRQRLVLLDYAQPQILLFAARRLQHTLAGRLGLSWELVASPAVPEEQVGLALRIDPETILQAQGYTLLITPEGIRLTGHDAAGVFYGVCSLVQLVEAYGRRLPCLEIDDWPDFPVRGVMLDVSRDKVPTMETLHHLVDLLASWKINQLQLYIEHTFAYRQHPEVWEKASPFTGEEILALDAFCQARHIELVPNQNSFGHMHRWLQHPRYAQLAEITGGYDMPCGRQEGSFSLCPGDPGSLALLDSLYAELLPHFSSRLFNVGCDETFDVGQGRSKDVVAARGAGRVYLDFLLEIYRRVKAHGRTMMFWGDIVLHYPDLIPELPKDAIALEWGYESDHAFASHCEQFAAAGLPFYVCPGTSAWASLGGRSSNAIANLLYAAENGLKWGAAGYLNTDWGDHGHWQTLPVSYLGFAAGAAYSWALEANRALDVCQATSRHAFRDPTGAMGRVAYDLGEVYRAFDITFPNTSALFNILQRPFDKVRSMRGLNVAGFERAIAAIDAALAPLAQAPMERPDAALVRREIELTARLMRHAAWRGLLAFDGESSQAARLAWELDRELQELVGEYRQVWLSRNRPGGLEDSVGRLERARQDYKAVEDYQLQVEE